MNWLALLIFIVSIAAGLFLAWLVEHIDAAIEELLHD